MSSTQVTSEPQSTTPAAVDASVDQKLEVITLPVSDVDRAKRFYTGLGWRVDADFSNGDSWRVVQLTPPGSPCSIHFGKGLITSAPGAVQRIYLVVDDIVAARAELISRGASVSEIFHTDPATGRGSGRDPQHRSYSSYASFSDPDGNGWVLQEVTTRLPGRGFSTLDVPTLTALLREAEERHGTYEPTAPKHHWSSFYSAYIVAREQGRTPEEAVSEGVRNVEMTRQ